MAGGAPPMDPSMMGAAPPMDPAAAGMPPAGGDPMEMLRQVVREEIAAAKGGETPEEGGSDRVTNRDLDARLDSLEQMIGMMAEAMGIAPLPNFRDMDVGFEAALSIGLKRP